MKKKYTLSINTAIIVSPITEGRIFEWCLKRPTPSTKISMISKNFVLNFFGIKKKNLVRIFTTNGLFTVEIISIPTPMMNTAISKKISIRRGFEIFTCSKGIRAITMKMEKESKTLSIKMEGRLFEIGTPFVLLRK